MLSGAKHLNDDVSFSAFGIAIGHSTYPSGSEILRFAQNLIEKGD
ncbi:MAG: hypothetical protein AAB209_04590 [Bacteroidota bacterium]